MSNMSSSLIFALILGMAKASYEWKGIFYTPENTYKWGAEKVDGDYVDPAMKFIAIPASSATQQELTNSDSAGTTAFGLTCEDVQSGGTITPQENKCYRLVFDASSSQSLYTINASATTAIAFYCEHLPTEFEATEHYFKDNSGVDIEPVAQDPVPGGGHSHGGGGAMTFDSYCVCQAADKGWLLDCSNQVAINESVSNLDANSACMAANPPADCTRNYHIMQAHHDHCLHDQLPTGIEQRLHDYEHYYEDCFVKRQFDANLNACPTVTCSDSTALTTAVQTLQAGCNTTQSCAASGCAAAIKTVLMAHDTCAEGDLPNNLENALHDHEYPCAAQLCNTASSAFNPYDEPCQATASGASRFGSQEALFLTTSALPLALFLSS